ncbi:MAG TPA: protein kinase, partial [Capsulimonadaceae bacterium]|nr:protein kinase [Capsulimonadaceae bacterium]
MASILNDRFELIEPLPLPAGDFSRVAYKARETVSSSPPGNDDVSAGRVVILRLLPQEAASPALAEASELAAKLKSHPNILAHYGLTKIASQTDIEPGLYSVSEFARGLTLRERIRRVAPFSLAVALDIALSIAKALVYAHDRGVTHGDLRPEEILLTPEGQVRVADFAIARAARDAMGDTSNAYQNDLRAIGLLLYEMLTGVAPDQMGVIGEQSP